MAEGLPDLSRLSLLSADTEVKPVKPNKLEYVRGEKIDPRRLSDIWRKKQAPFKRGKEKAKEDEQKAAEQAKIQAEKAAEKAEQAEERRIVRFANRSKKELHLKYAEWIPLDTARLEADKKKRREAKAKKALQAGSDPSPQPSVPESGGGESDSDSEDDVPLAKMAERMRAEMGQGDA